MSHANPDLRLRYISALYLSYGDRAPLPYSLVMAALAGFIAYGRFVLRPL